MSAWQAAVNGAGARPWFVFRTVDGVDQYHENRRGDLVRFATMKSADRAAKKLNESAKPVGSNVFRYLDLSTSHLTEAECNELSGVGPTGQYVMGDLEHSPRVISHDYGAWVNVPALDGSWLPRDSLALEQTRPNLAACIALAQRNRCTWINFDRDADTDAGLPTFDW